MKALLIPIVMLLVGLAGGIGAGYLTRPEPTAEQIAAAEAEAAEKAAEEEPDVEFARLNNQFVIPIVRENVVGALVVMSITLEVASGGTSEVFAKEPRLRDSFLRVLFDHANAGGFDGAFTQTGKMTILRQSLEEAAKKSLGDVVKDVLIIDIVRQEV